LFVLRSNVVQSVPIVPGAPPPITALLPARQGGLWVGTAIGLLRFQNGQTNWLRSELGPPLRNVRAIIEDREGNLWFGSGGNGIGCLQPDSAWAHYEIGATLLKTGDFKTAIVHLEIATGRLPNFAPAHLSLAEAYEHTGRTEDAKRERTRVPKNP
jgi:ligand-binding sensor domain-containing protein